MEKDLGTTILEVFKEDVQRKFINMEIVGKKIDEEIDTRQPKRAEKNLNSFRYLISKDNQSLSQKIIQNYQVPLKLPFKNLEKVLSQTCLSRNDLHLQKRKFHDQKSFIRTGEENK